MYLLSFSYFLWLLCSPFLAIGFILTIYCVVLIALPHHENHCTKTQIINLLNPCSSMCLVQKRTSPKKHEGEHPEHQHKPSPETAIPPDSHFYRVCSCLAHSGPKALLQESLCFPLCLLCPDLPGKAHSLEQLWTPWQMWPFGLASPGQPKASPKLAQITLSYLIVSSSPTRLYYIYQSIFPLQSF